MSASPQDLMTAKLFFNAAFPTMQVLLDDDPKLHKKFQNFNATVQFGAMNDGELLCCHLIFQNGNLTVVQGPAEKSDISLTFSSVEKMNSLLKGGLSLPSIKGHLSLLPHVLSILMGLKIMTKPNDKLGDPDMQEFCRRQPDRIYQFQVEHDGQPDYIACYLRVKAGQSKSGHGVYTRRSPFVLFHFFSLDGALKVLGKECEFVEGVEKGYVETIGSPEYACYLNDYMAILQGMLT